MEKKIFNLLEKSRLEKYYTKFLQLGVKDERDFLDISDENIMELTQVEKNRFAELKIKVKRLRGPSSFPTQGEPVQKSLNAYCLKYTYPHCSETKYIKDLEPSQITLDDLMLRICHQEENKNSVCLYTEDGMPLTEDPFFNTWSLNERHIENGSVLYAIFTPTENLRPVPQIQQQVHAERLGEETIRCHVMLKGDYEITVDLTSDTMKDLRLRLANETGIPAHVLHYNGDSCSFGDTLQDCGITVESTVHFYLTSFPEENSESDSFFKNNITPSVQQTQKGLSVFWSTLYSIKRMHSGEGFKKVISYIRKLTGCHPLAQSLYQLLRLNEITTVTQKIAIVEGLYVLFRELLPRLPKQSDGKIFEDHEVFESANVCWAHLIAEAESHTSEHENYAPISLTSQQGKRFSDPVLVPGTPEVFERAYVQQKIKDGEKIPNCSDDKLQVTSIKKATDVEKILLSTVPSVNTYHLWISCGQVTCQNFQICDVKPFSTMTEDVKKYPHLLITPPLTLKDTGLDPTRLVFLKEDTLGVYTSKDKASPQRVQVFNCMTGKHQSVDVNQLAKDMRDKRSDQTLMCSRVPKEAIMVLMDASSSMESNCFEEDEMKRIDAVKELFGAFTDRTNAYNFQHVIGLVKFDSLVHTEHTFTETLDTFMEYVRNLEASGQTKLYDALQHAIPQLATVKKQFPDCRLRIICLTDGKDEGSVTQPDVLVANLLRSDIVVDAILVGKVENKVLHGISNATGGCCFKPNTCKDGLKLFELETVLSMEMRKPKKKVDPSAITSLDALTTLFATQGYDEKPENVLPVQYGSKVTVTENALKKNLKGRFSLEKERRILLELKSLHCDPHPYCSIYPSESDITFWKILMQGPPDTSYENGVFELFCQFGDEYPVKPPLVRFVTNVYHCNINSVGRICHNIFDRNYSAHVTMKEILDAIYGLLIIPEPDDPLDSVLAEEFMSSREKYEEKVKKNTEEIAGTSIDDMEKKWIDPDTERSFIPPHLICPLTKKLFVVPVKTKYGTIYEQKAIYNHLKKSKMDPQVNKLLRRTDMKPDHDMKKMVKIFRSQQIKETAV